MKNKYKDKKSISKYLMRKIKKINVRIKIIHASIIHSLDINGNKYLQNILVKKNNNQMKKTLKIVVLKEENQKKN